MGGAFFAQVAQKSAAFLWRKGEKTGACQGFIYETCRECYT